MSDAYDRKKIAGGKLTLKSDNSKKSKKHKKQKIDNIVENEEIIEDEKIPVNEGSGRLVSSGETLHGFESRFKSEAEIGDKILVHHPATLEVESGIIVGILSDRNCTLHQGFSSDLISTSTYYIKKDSILINNKKDIEDNNDIKNDIKNDEFNKRLQKQIKKQKSNLTYREKTGMWGYKTVKTELDREYSKEELLDLREKKSRDKFI
eukprot:GHVL01016047.1.p2 GENE.GHVL01016047.1~~GHVL01016047.1.p2  ORF type:complete len:207 (-),score=73.91 GHVL01016047.1:696-1316(-)